ncbi:MAG: phosphoglycerate dehydrogenase [Nisaea sp.]|uniref:phosphoglycerate dehydrogenase n=1 Tax=Nisaea sp. TaxID=2024842 RepID=UPI001B02D3F9|nr:phosphoglycerate dehydrogenase [Nisaea sp.]MBO6561357.1 phosphoglycerate dehydrogenase [Nisaea sp.]
MKPVRVAVASRSFSKHPVLRAELLARFPNTTFNDAGVSLKGTALIDFLKGHERAITALERLDDALFAAVPELKVIGKYGVGTDMIDLEAMRRHGVSLGWIAGVNKRSVAELAVSFAIALLRHVPAAAAEARSGQWRQLQGRQLSGRTVGIVGCGHVGKDLVRLLKPFGCTILVHDVRSFPDFYTEHGIEAVGLDALLARAEIVTLHIPLDETTRGLLSAERLKLMRPDAVLLNLARGGLVDEEILKVMLKDGRLAAAGFDVFTAEPPEDLELLSLPNFLGTPHIGGASEEAVLAMGRAAIAGLEDFGDPVEVVAGQGG